MAFEKVYFIIGGVKDKAWGEITRILPKEYIYLLVKPNTDRAKSTNDLKKYFIENDLKYLVKNDINNALKYCRKISNKNDLIFIGGSLFLISDYNEK